MARPFNIRPRYRPGEQTGPEQFSNALVSGLDAISQESQARTNEENSIRQQGGVPVGDAPTARSRFNDVRRGVSRVFGRGGPPSVMVDETTRTPPFVAPPNIPPRQSKPSYNASPATTEDSLQQISYTPARLPAATQPAPQRGIASALNTDIGDTSYEMTARSGQHYKIDPLRNDRARMALGNQQNIQQKRDDYMVADEHRSKDEQDEINALVATGQWSPAQASARVKGKLQYGEEYGRTRQQNQLTFEQRQALLDRTNKGREAVARIMSSGRETTAQDRQAIQQQVLDLRAAALAMQQAGLEATGYENEARALEAKIPTGTNRIVEEAQPGGKARVAETEQRAATLRSQAEAARRRGAGGGAKTRITQSEYDSARRLHPDSTIAKSYDLTGIRRKP